MSVHFPIIVITLFVFLREATPLECYVCTKCPADPTSDPNVKKQNDCPACVIEDKFDYRKYLQTDRSCTECPGKRLEMTNNNRSFYHCCKEDLCLGSDREGVQEISRIANIGVTLRKPSVDNSAKVPKREEENAKAPGKEVQSKESITETTTKPVESLLTATNDKADLNQENPVQVSDNTNLSTGTTKAESTTASNADESIPDSRSKTSDLSMQPTSGSAEEKLRSSSAATDHGVDVNPEVPTQTLDDADMPSIATNAKSTRMVGGEEEIAEPKMEEAAESVGTAVKSATQDLGDSSPPTCHMSVWYLAFSISLICGLVAHFN